MNCLAGCLQIAGTVTTHVISSSESLAVDWSESSTNTCCLKNRRACANTLRAGYILPLAALISTPLFNSYIIIIKYIVIIRFIKIRYVENKTLRNRLDVHTF